MKFVYKLAPVVRDYDGAAVPWTKTEIWLAHFRAKTIARLVAPKIITHLSHLIGDRELPTFFMALEWVCCCAYLIFLSGSQTSREIDWSPRDSINPHPLIRARVSLDLPLDLFPGESGRIGSIGSYRKSLARSPKRLLLLVTRFCCD